MAVEYEQISDDDLNKSLLGNRATQVIVAPSPAAAPVAEKPRTAVAPPKRSSDASSIAGASAPPVAATVDLPALVQQVTEGTTQMQENLPKPNTQDSAQQMMDLIGKHWQVPAAIAGTAAAAAILHHIMKKDGGAGPPPPPGGLANPIEPQMSTNQQRPTEPYLEVEKPTIQSRTFGSKESMVETGINNKYPFTLQDAKTALGLSNVPIKSVQDAEIVAQQYAKQLQNQSSLAAAVSTPAPSLANPSPSTTPTFVAEPISTTPVTAAQTAATTATETSAPKATLEQQVKVIKETETPETKAEPANEKAAKTAKTPKLPQPAGTGGGDNWLHSMAGPEIYADVIKRKNGNKPYGPGEASQNKAYADWKEYQNEVGRMRPYTNKPVFNLQELEKQKFKSANIEGRIPLSSVPPPSLRPNEIGQGGGSLIRSLTDPLQLKQ